MTRFSWITRRIAPTRACPGVLCAALLGLLWLSPAPTRAAPAAPAGQGIHVVIAGDTLWSIAARHDTSVEAIAGANRLASIHRLQIGDVLKLTPRIVIPPVPSSVANRHVVRSGETLWAIAGQHGATTRTVVRMNALTDEGRLRVGQVLNLPVPPPARGSRTPSVAAMPAVRPRFGWPSRGVVTSRFGYRGRSHHHGIDIAAPGGTPITAARDGVVRFAGWMSGYGRLVIVDHGAGLATWYGHASTIVTRGGRRVRRGQLIARVGRTGQATGPNLHFEVRQDNRPLDPLAFLRKDAR